MTITIKNKINIVIDRVSPLWDTFITLSYDGKSYTKDTDSSGILTMVVYPPSSLKLTSTTMFTINDVRGSISG